MNPFALLIDIATRSRANAKELPQQLEAIEYWRGVGFMLGGHYCLAGMGQVSEILHMPKLTSVPGVRKWVLGVANVRGRLVPIMDLSGLLGLVGKPGLRTRRVLVVEQGDILVGLLVDAVLGMQQFPLDRMRTLPVSKSGLSGFVDEGFVKDERVWNIFQMGQLVQSPEFLQVAV